jgi:hypothetical protein
VSALLQALTLLGTDIHRPLLFDLLADGGHDDRVRQAADRSRPAVARRYGPAGPRTPAAAWRGGRSRKARAGPGPAARPCPSHGRSGGTDTPVTALRLVGRAALPLPGSDEAGVYYGHAPVSRLRRSLLRATAYAMRGRLDPVVALVDGRQRGVAGRPGTPSGDVSSEVPGVTEGPATLRATRPPDAGRRSRLAATRTRTSAHATRPPERRSTLARCGPGRGSALGEQTPDGGGGPRRTGSGRDLISRAEFVGPRRCAGWLRGW